MTGTTISSPTWPSYQELLLQNQSQKEYTSILEKTNQQLSLRSNPYGVMVGILSALIAIGAIAVAIYLFKQSSDYKQQQKELQQKYEDNLNTLLENEKIRIQETSERHEKIFKENSEKLKEDEHKLQNLIETYENKLTSTTEENQEEIKKILSDLKKEKEKVTSEISTPTVPVEIADASNEWVYGYENKQKKVIKCPNCKHGFYVTDSNPYGHLHSATRYTSRIARSGIIPDLNYEAECPYCGNKCYVD